MITKPRSTLVFIDININNKAKKNSKNAKITSNTIESFPLN